MAHPNQDRDQELYDQRQAELAADREEHNQKVGGGAYPQKYEEKRKELDTIS